MRWVASNKLSAGSEVMNPAHFEMASAAQRVLPLALAVALYSTSGPSANAQVPAPPSSPRPVVNYEYYSQGNPKRVIQAPQVPGFDFSTSFTIDSLGRRRVTTDARAGTATMDMLGRDEPIQIQDPRGLVTQYGRDGFGQTAQTTSPDTGTAITTFDAVGNLKTRQDSRGVLATYSYDALNRARSVVYTFGGQPPLATNWNYDETGPGYAYGVGRLTSTSYFGGASRYTYDPQGRLTSETQITQTGGSGAINLRVSYQYDAAGQVASIIYPSGRVLQIKRVGGLPSGLQVGAPRGSKGDVVMTEIAYEPFGAVRSWRWPMRSVPNSNRIYDDAGRPVRYNMATVTRDVSYDAADRIIAYTHYNAIGGATLPALNQSFSYDELGRLTGLVTASPSGNATFSYDANGNRTAKVEGGVPSVATVASDSNRILALSNPQRTLTHDAAGNIYGDVRQGLGWTAGYDLANRLVVMRVTRDGTNFESTGYLYNAFGQRVAKLPGVQEVCNGTSCAAPTAPSSAGTLYMHDAQGKLLGEYRATDGSPVREYLWLDSTPVAMLVFGQPGAAATIYYIAADHLDTPRIVFDSAGRIRWSWLADPFGTAAPNENRAGVGAFQVNLRFPGQYHDAESGLSFNYFRHYDPSMGRYVQSDPIGLPGGINTYTYVDGNPLSYVDPEGLQVLPLPPPPFIPPVIPRPDYPHTPAPPSFTWPNLLPQPWVDKIIQM